MGLTLVRKICCFAGGNGEGVELVHGLGDAPILEIILWK